jgi:type II secretory ATPase GspE/PulE/Tfp pilus assembly ATPase PilB-like protein
MSTNSKKITEEIKIEPELFLQIKENITNIPSFGENLKISISDRTTEILQKILGGAVVLGVSDIHFEPKKENSKIRVRSDGLLQQVVEFDHKTYNKIVSRIKLLAELKLNIKDRPQDGRFSIALPEKPEEAITKYYTVEVRVSVLPSEYGETLVLRILDPKSLISFKKLGLRPDLLDLFVKEMNQPNGMVIVTGPTGSGKTTTLYAFLKEAQSPENKIITIEDPIEYHLSGISQTQVNPSKDYTFANGLRSVMRQDPDVILVGEIRDLETATIALQAALTGHLVFSTLHTNSAAGTIPRLQALGEQPVNIAPAINLAIAQRLIRRVCKYCKKERDPTEKELQQIKEALKGLPDKANKPKIGPNFKVFEPVGCKECNNTGYKGRIGIFEALVVDDEIEKFILTSPSTAALKEKAMKKGMTTIYQDGILKVAQGATTMEEIERITGQK